MALSLPIVVLLACCAAPTVVDAAAVTAESRANPIRKVVNLLMNMQKKIEQDGEKAEVLFNKFMCYCETGAGSLNKQIAEAEDRIPQLQSSIEELSATHQQLSEELKQHKTDRQEAKEAVETANALRAKEAAAFAKESTELKANIDGVARAVDAISKGVAGFLQTRAAGVVRQLAVSMDMSGSDRDMLSAFLSVSDSSDNAQQYAPQSGEILGILKQMVDEMQKDLVDLQEDEDSRLGMHNSLIAAKTKEIGAASKAIESKTGRIGDLAVQIATLKNDLEDTSEALAENQAFAANLGKMCATKKTEWALYQKTHAEEAVAIAETIKVLNDDDALDLMKKTLPAPSASAAAANFLQVRAEAREPIRRQRALQALRVAGAGDRRLALLALALRGRKAGFGEVIKMVAELVALLQKEQAADDSKKEWCQSETDKTEDEIKGLKRDISDIGKAIAEAEDSTVTLKGEIESLTAGIQALDKQVDEATEQRKEENAEYTESLAANNAAKSLLEIAKNRLNKFYNPKLYAAPKKRDLSDEQQITMNMGGTLAPTAPPGGIAGTGIESFLQASARTRRSDDGDGDAPPPAPDADLNYKKQGESSGGVIAMIDLLKADLVQQIQELEMTEKEAQSDYEKFTKDSSEKRALDSKTIADKEGAKAELEAEIQSNHEDLKSNKAELMGTSKELADLHGSCDWLLQNFDLRKEARANEVDALNKATAVLSGAEYSF